MITLIFLYQNIGRYILQISLRYSCVPCHTLPMIGYALTDFCCRDMDPRLILTPKQRTPGATDGLTSEVSSPNSSNWYSHYQSPGLWNTRKGVAGKQAAQLGRGQFPYKLSLYMCHNNRTGFTELGHYWPGSGILWHGNVVIFLGGWFNNDSLSVRVMAWHLFGLFSTKPFPEPVIHRPWM